MITWLVKKLAFKAVGTTLAPFKMWAIIIAVSALVGFVGYYIYTA